jgi:hypothetical protein
MYQVSRLLFCCMLLFAYERPGADDGEAMSPEDFQKRYKPEVAPLLSAYSRVTVVAIARDIIKNEKKPDENSEKIWTLQYYRDNHRAKVMRDFTAGRSQKHQWVSVATPELSFDAERVGDGKFVAMNISTQGTSYERFFEGVINQTTTLMAPYCMYENSLPVFLFSTPKVHDVKQETVDNKPFVRVYVRGKPWTDQLKKWGVETIEGWFLFEPKAYWASHGFEVHYKDSANSPLATYSGLIEYGDTNGGYPVPGTVKLVVAANGAQREYRADVQSVQFGAVPDSEFTPKGCGVADIDMPIGDIDIPIGDIDMPMPILYMAIGISFFAVLVILIVRRNRPKPIH